MYWYGKHVRLDKLRLIQTNFSTLPKQKKSFVFFSFFDFGFWNKYQKPTGIHQRLMCVNQFKEIQMSVVLKRSRLYKKKKKRNRKKMLVTKVIARGENKRWSESNNNKHQKTFENTRKKIPRTSARPWNERLKKYTKKTTKTKAARKRCI